MSISIECRGCAMRYRVASHLAGERVKCKKCGEPIAVPGSEEDRPPIEIPLRPDSDAPVVRPKPPPLVAIRIPDPVPEFSTLPEITPPVLNAAAAFPFVPSPPPRQTIARPRDTDDRPRRRPTTAAPEGFSPMLLMIYVGVQIASAIYFSTRPNVAVSLVWTLYISEIVSFFAIVAPMAWLGIWGASRAMSYELAEPAYIKSAAVAVAPAMLLILIKTLPDNPVLILLCAAAILPATFLLIKLLFALTTLEAFVTYLLGAISCTIGAVDSDWADRRHPARWNDGQEHGQHRQLASVCKSVQRAAGCAVTATSASATAVHPRPDLHTACPGRSGCHAAGAD